jgi:16S rRNA (cytosine967-C5)-methyltransferase
MSSPVPPTIPPVSPLAAMAAARAVAAAGRDAGSAASAIPPGAIPLARLLDLCADAVQAVREGRSLTDALARVPADARAGVQALSFEVLRRLGGALAVRGALAPRQPAPPVDALLLTALALLWPPAAGQPPAYADHTLVDQAAHATRLRSPNAVGFVNAVLRRFIRERETCVAAAQRTPEGAYNHPLWWIERVRADWPRCWEALLHAANRHPPMTLRVNARRGSGAAYLQRLAAQGRAATLLNDPALGGQAVRLAQPCPVQALPGFAEGEVSVQDAAAQRAARWLLGDAGTTPSAAGSHLPPPLRPGARVLDACAAPGGKTAHLLELAEIDLVALDSDPQRLARVQETLDRLRLPHAGGRVALRAADARDPRSWWDGKPFEAILLDAPCTASGIVRRHPDIRWLRRAEDIATLARVQAELLDALWPLLAPGGRLLYATCSLFRAEGERQIDAFLQRQGLPPATRDPHAPGHLLPLHDNPGAGAADEPAAQDGFFYALLHKP